jgi:hypothetical protein
MGPGFKRREPTQTSRFYDNSMIVGIVQRCEWLGYFERLRGFMQDHEYVTTIRGLTFRINEASIKNVSSLLLGIPSDKEER